MSKHSSRDSPLERQHNVFFSLLYHSFSPESVRWFLVKGKTKQAENILHKVAKFNKKPIPHEKLQDCEKQRLGDLRDLFKSKSIAHKTLVSWFCWWVIKFSIYFNSYTCFCIDKFRLSTQNKNARVTLVLNWALNERAFSFRKNQFKKEAFLFFAVRVSFTATSAK